jgi:maltose O-acetyltransferase
MACPSAWSRRWRVLLLAWLKYVPLRTTMRVRVGLYRRLFAAMGEEVKIKEDVQIDAPQNIEVGNRVGISQGCFLSAGCGIRIGDDVMIGHQVSVLSEGHASARLDVPMREQGLVGGPIVIGNDVWIGAGARILPGVSIGSGCIVGANAVVTGDLPERAVAIGVPARVLRLRDDEGA